MIDKKARYKRIDREISIAFREAREMCRKRLKKII
jgi:hypothetical protein